MLENEAGEPKWFEKGIGGGAITCVTFRSMLEENEILNLYSLAILYCIVWNVHNIILNVS